MAKEKNIVTKMDYWDVYTYLFNISSNPADIIVFNDFWKKHIKGKSIPFNNLLILKIIIDKYKSANDFDTLTYNYIKIESLFIKLNPKTDKEIEIFLNLCDILIKCIDNILVEQLIDFNDVFSNKDNELKILNYIANNEKMIYSLPSLFNTIKNIRKIFIDEKKFCQILLFIFYKDRFDKSVLESIQSVLEVKDIELIIPLIINNDITDKKDILEKLKSLRDKYKNIEKKNDILSSNLDGYSTKINELTTHIDQELQDLRDVKVEGNDNSRELEYQEYYNSNFSEDKFYHSKFPLVSKVLFMNNYVCISGPKECGKKHMINDLKDSYKNNNFIQIKYEEAISRLSEIYKVLTEGGILSIEIDNIIRNHGLNNFEISGLINASKNLGNYIIFNNQLIKINPMFRLCIINHNNKEFNEYIKDNSLVNIECYYDEFLEENLTSPSMMSFFKEYRKDLNRYGVELTTKEINEPRNSYEMIELFKEKEKLIPKDKKNNINLYINLTQSYDPSNLLYSLFYEWQDSLRRNIDILFMNEEHKKKLIKRMR